MSEQLSIQSPHTDVVDKLQTSAIFQLLKTAARRLGVSAVPPPGSWWRRSPETPHPACGHKSRRWCSLSSSLLSTISVNFFFFNSGLGSNFCNIFKKPFDLVHFSISSYQLVSLAILITTYQISHVIECVSSDSFCGNEEDSGFFS